MFKEQVRASQKEAETIPLWERSGKKVQCDERKLELKHQLDPTPKSLVCHEE